MNRDQPIITSFWAKPIPDRNFDWEAVRQGYDDGNIIGRGITELAAITDLITQEEAAV